MIRAWHIPGYLGNASQNDHRDRGEHELEKDQRGHREGEVRHPDAAAGTIAGDNSTRIRRMRQ